MTQDVSNQTVMILAILTIIISVLGAATVIFETNNYRQSTKDSVAETESKTTGTISLSIAQEPEKHSTQGSIQLNVKNEENS